MARKNTKTTMPKRRNALAFLAKTQFRAATFDHKTAERGGATNTMAEFMEDYVNDSVADDDSEWD